MAASRERHFFLLIIRIPLSAMDKVIILATLVLVLAKRLAELILYYLGKVLADLSAPGYTIELYVGIDSI